jgi:uncharacterized protein (UPF0261 family)/ABC-type branched-subunit amino acid transport system ATPase component
VSVAAKAKSSAPVLEVSDLQVHYGLAHVLQGISLKLDKGVLGVIGRNGMGKTTLCQTIMGLKPATSGSIKFLGRELIGLQSNKIAELGIGYVPQGRRTWPTLTVDEHLRLVAQTRPPKGGWTIQRVYENFPRLAERRKNGGTQLSGGEQQMLAIGRALLLNPRLLVMDEPTEGLAPVIVDQVEALLKKLAAEGSVAVLLVEQNLGVATQTAERVAIVVNGRIARELPAADLAADRALQERLLGVRSHAEDEAPAQAVPDATPEQVPVPEAPVKVLRVVRAAEPGAETAPGYSATRAPTRWSQGDPAADRIAAIGPVAAKAQASDEPPPMRMPAPGEMAGRNVLVVGTFDTKARELLYMKGLLDRLGLKTVSVDLSTSRKPSPADVPPQEVARHHPKGIAGVFTDDRGSSVAAMAQAFERFVSARRDIAGMLSAGGSGGTSLATPGMRRLPVGVPKIMVSTVASGDVGRYVGPADIMMMYSVVDVQGLNRISEQVLANAAHAMAGMVANKPKAATYAKPALGMTMFGVTTPCVQELQRLLSPRYDCLVFHATGTGGQSMEKLADSGLLEGVIDATTTEVCDLLMGGVFPCTEDRFGAFARTRIPYVGSCGALDMVNFGPMDTVPSKYRGRNLYVHNPQVTLMRTTPEENARMGQWIAEKLNKCDGPVRFFLPEGGVSLIDVPGKPFHDPAADKALFDALARTLKRTENRQLLRLPYAINDPAFAKAMADAYLQLVRAPSGAAARA